MSETTDTCELWLWIFSAENTVLTRRRRMFRHMPTGARCRVCYAPLHGPSAFLVRSLMHIERSNLSPTLCNGCEMMARKNPGGVEAPLTMMFADVRGSTGLAETMSGQAFSQLMNRFYTVATGAIVQSDGMIEKFIGDEVAALYFPGFSGTNYTQRAVDAARHLLRATGHDDPNGPWLPVGAGVHTGTAFVGALGQGGVAQITAVGDAVNLAARLASTAPAGEILVTDEAYAEIEPEPTTPEHRELELKGKSEPIGVHVLKVGR